VSLDDPHINRRKVTSVGQLRHRDDVTVEARGLFISLRGS
jgi:hypothetical protein